jgi:hypothetical protein
MALTLRLLMRLYSDNAEVSVDVTCKRRWTGTIELENLRGEWKITQLKLSRY